MNLVSRRNPYRHKVFANDETELGRWLGREFPDHRELFVYFHCETGNYVVGAWESSDKAAFHDVLNIGPDCTWGWNKAKLIDRLNPPDPREWIDGVADEEYRDNRARTDESLTASEKRHFEKRPMILVP